MSHDSRPPLGGLHPPEAPPELRERVLAAARDAVASGDAGTRETGPPTTRPWTDRLWESRGLRLAWAASVLLLLLANFLFDVGRPKPTVRASHPNTVTESAERGAPGSRPMTLAEARHLLASDASFADLSPIGGDS